MYKKNQHFPSLLHCIVAVMMQISPNKDLIKASIVWYSILLNYSLFYSPPLGFIPDTDVRGDSSPWTMRRPSGAGRLDSPSQDLGAVCGRRQREHTKAPLIWTEEHKTRCKTKTQKKKPHTPLLKTTR